MVIEADIPLAVEEAASTFAALGSEQRLTVLNTLVRAGPEGLPIGELGERSGVTGSTLTHHVRILTQAGLLHRVKRGRSIICAAVAFPRVQALSAYLLSECCTDSSHPHESHPHGRGPHE
ncbi:MAG: metalloregulator ArsR/SmtB family transcription factor [Spirochaetaceae bacterium]|nr:metalloregulator ArsR/SmtB family transcription factor [Spirochaetaceae bacterium]